MVRPVTSGVVPEGLSTPSTLVIADRLERNLASMASFAATIRTALRPHAKTHKCVEIANKQMALGARGISVATVGEAEALTAGARSASAGSAVDDVFVCYPLWPAGDLVDRLSVLAERVRVRVGSDSPDAVERLSALAGRIGVMIEVDCGLGRSGVPPSGALAVARAAERCGLAVDGVFTFPGHGYRPGAAEAAAADEVAALDEAAGILNEQGFDGLERSGGSTPTARKSTAGGLTESRPGVYVFNDAQQVELGVAGFADVALVVAATVVSRPARGRIVLDSGSKVLGADRPAWSTGHGRLLDWPDARIVGLWEHHAVVSLDGPVPSLGEVVAVLPNHVCSAVNLVPEMLVVDDGHIVDAWPVAARGANR
jgi:D-serine deaminase-like pyridoxal phosphate-dependent protein